MSKRVSLEEAYKLAEKDDSVAIDSRENIRRVLVRTNIRRHAFNVLPEGVDLARALAAFSYCEDCSWQAFERSFGELRARAKEFLSKASTVEVEE